MTGLIIVLAFLLLGVVVVLVAMSGGPRGARRTLRSSDARRNTRAVVVVAGAVIVSFGIAVPALTFGLSDNESDGPAGIQLTATQSEGRELFAQHCANCHTLSASNAVGRVGPNLDVMRPNVQLTLEAIDQGRARGAGQMPSDLLHGDKAQAVAEYIEAVAGRVR